MDNMVTGHMARTCVSSARILERDGSTGLSCCHAAGDRRRMANLGAHHIHACIGCSADLSDDYLHCMS